MIEVSRDAFFRTIGPMNVHPRAERDRSDWVDQTTHRTIGRTEPGYIWTQPVKPETRFFLAPELAKRS